MYFRKHRLFFKYWKFLFLQEKWHSTIRSVWMKWIHDIRIHALHRRPTRRKTISWEVDILLFSCLNSDGICSSCEALEAAFSILLFSRCTSDGVIVNKSSQMVRLKFRFVCKVCPLECRRIVIEELKNVRKIRILVKEYCTRCTATLSIRVVW